jgi:hypothetical protein
MQRCGESTQLPGPSAFADTNYFATEWIHDDVQRPCGIRLLGVSQKLQCMKS